MTRSDATETAVSCQSPAMAVFLSLSAFSIGQAIQVENGFFAPEGLLWLTAGIFTCILGVVPLATRLLPIQGDRIAKAVLVGCLYVQLYQIFRWGSFRHLKLQDPSEYGIFLLPIGLVAFAVPGIMIGSRTAQRYFFSIVVFGYLFAGSWVIRHSPNQDVDVVLFHHTAISALAEGQNPYTVTFPDVYADTQTRVDHYGPGLFENGRSTFGFMYPALSLLLSSPGHFLAGDFRYSSLLSSSIAAILMTYLGGGTVGYLAATLFLFTPRSFFVLEMGWTEPLALMLVSLTAFCASRSSRFLSVAVGLLLAVKQYLIFAVPSLLLLLKRPLSHRSALDFSTKVLLTASTVTLPLAFWNLPAYFRSTVFFHLRQPFRPDSLSYTVLLSKEGILPATAALGFLTLLPTTVFTLWKLPRSASGFAAGIALTFLCFFCLNQQAFANYYYFVIGALCCSVASMRGVKEQNETDNSHI